MDKDLINGRALSALMVYIKCITLDALIGGEAWVKAVIVVSAILYALLMISSFVAYFAGELRLEERLVLIMTGMTLMDAIASLVMSFILLCM